MAFSRIKKFIKNVNSHHDSAPPTDLSQKIYEWFGQTWRLVNQLGYAEFISAYTAMADQHSNPDFLVMFVGEFNQGKSTLINRLLEREFLPVGILPTTALLISIKAGSEESIHISMGMGTDFTDDVEERPLRDDAWHDLVINNFANEESPSLIKEVEVTIDNPGYDSLMQN